MRKEKGITLVALVVTIIILIILAGVSINAIIGENGIITIAKRAKENVELAQIEEQTKLNELYMQIEREEETIEGTISYDAILRLNEFKKKIADYIDEAANGSIDLTNEYEKPDYQTASVETFGSAIKQIVAKVTALDEAKAAIATDITEGKEAWVNGTKVVGTNSSTGEIKFTLIDYSSYYGGFTLFDVPPGKTASWTSESVTSTVFTDASVHEIGFDYLGDKRLYYTTTLSWAQDGYWVNDSNIIHYVGFHMKYPGSDSYSALPKWYITITDNQ